MASGEVQHVQVAGRTLRVSSLDKVIYPSTGTTKGEVLNYYVRSPTGSCPGSPPGR